MTMPTAKMLRPSNMGTADKVDHTKEKLDGVAVLTEISSTK